MKTNSRNPRKRLETIVCAGPIPIYPQVQEFGTWIRFFSRVILQVNRTKK